MALHPRKRTLTADQVAEIKRLILDGAGTMQLAERYGCTSSNIRAIKSGFSWGWVEPAEAVER